MLPVAVQQHENKIKEAKERLARARQAFYDAKTDEEVHCLKNLTLAYRALKKHQAETVKTVCLTKHVERTPQPRNESRINWNE